MAAEGRTDLRKRLPRQASPERHPMKSTAHLYLPWSVIQEWLAMSMGSQLAEVQPGRPRGSVASERLTSRASPGDRS
jgi:hypothetical protein